MRILFIGDVYGKTGRLIVNKYVANLRKKMQIDFVIANGENSTHGNGLSQKHYQELVDSGVDAITMGNHFFTHTESNTFYLSAAKLIRPANIHPSASGIGSRVFEVNGRKIRVTNLLGHVYMHEGPTNPFTALDEILANSQEKIHIVDFHAEATAEKIAFGWAYNGLVSAVLGTHTHVQTADERILSKGTAYITDVGMSGPYNSVIGANIEQIVYKTRNYLSKTNHFEVATGPGQFCAVIMEIDDESGRAISIERLFITPNNDW